MLTDLTDPERLVGTTLGRYRITKHLATGGMGAVYLGEHVEIQGRVAIKVLLPQCLVDPVLTRRFLDEARAVNRVDHPGIIRIHDCDTKDDLGAYLVMEYLEGQTLEERLKERSRCPL
jgi:serine/threonine protein kinase